MLKLVSRDKYYIFNLLTIMPSWTHVARPVFYSLIDVFILSHYSEFFLPPLNEYPSFAPGAKENDLWVFFIEVVRI